MTPSKARSRTTAFTATIVSVFAVLLLLVGCISSGPLTPVAVSEVKSVAGTWEGVVYQSNTEREEIALTIREDGSYDVVSRQTYGTSRGKGRIVIREGRLFFDGEKGRGVATLSSNSSGDRVMSIEATLSDNRLLTAKLWPTR